MLLKFRNPTINYLNSQLSTIIINLGDKKVIKNKKEILNNLYKVLQKRADFVVLGLSGGIDSAVLACICAKALKPDNVYAYGMPYNRIDWVKYNYNAEEIARNIKINYKTVPIYDVVEGYKDTIDFTLSEKNKGNLISRIRTNVLYTQNTRLKEMTDKVGLVIGTSNMTEMFIGSHVKGGDALGDIFPLGDIYKSEVYDFANYFSKIKMLNTKMIDYIPTTGLYGEKTTEELIGYNYEQIESVINDWTEYVQKPEEKNITELYNISEMHKYVLDSYFQNKHKYPYANIIPIRYLIKK